MLGNYLACNALDDNVRELRGKWQQDARKQTNIHIRGPASALKVVALPGASVETFISVLVPKLKAGLCCTCFSGSYAVGAETFTTQVVQESCRIV